MYKEINNVQVHYLDYGNKNGKPIVLLHGWGQNTEMMKPIGDPFAPHFRIVIVDLPGYGESSEPTYPWTLKDYVDCIKELLESMSIEKPILVGHSFGGKISLAYAGRYPVEKMALFGSPINPAKKKQPLKVRVLKALKKVPGLNKFEGFAKRHIGSTDYRQASDRMRQILVNTVNLDITDELAKIKCPTLIVWGTNDQAVPLATAYEIEKRIPDAGVVVYEGCSHYAYLERLGQTIQVLQNFLRG